ncbi:MAG: nucleoside kinase [Spirochaeta sp.]|nr:nucleoside kinase [Spirochaeta sp.]
MMVDITFPSGIRKKYPTGTPVENIIMHSDFLEKPYPLVAVKVNNDIASLTFRLEVNSHLAPVFLNSREGANIYRRSLCFLLTIAARDLFPKQRLVIGHSLGKGYFYYFVGKSEVDSSDLKQLKKKMAEIVEADLPIRRQVISYKEAVALFKRNNQPDTSLLLEHRNEPKIPVYECGSFLDLAHAPLAPRTGILKTFEIRKYASGFLLRYPDRGRHDHITAFRDNPALFSIYKEYKNWGSILKINCVGSLNSLINRGEIRQFIQVAEALHDKKIAQIADQICEKKEFIRLILIAGPSSSGKTTFSKKLAIQLKVLGRNPVAISLDDYFVSRELTPPDKDGNYDFEALEAIDIELLNNHLLKLFNGEEVSIPVFNFHTGRRRSKGVKMKVPQRSVLILEGIHALNDRLTPLISRENKYKIYISALTQLNLDDHNRISTTDNRLVRRLVRDHQFRGHSALDTFSMWQSVRNGEERNIFPFQDSADSAFNSALDYELAVLKVLTEPLLINVKPDSPYFHEARRLSSFLNNFKHIPLNWVPEHSILREFIGGSGFKY